ncbi:glycoside hydrolase family 3 N-terminal domain-containing protein [Beijerinckia indica]|uniref:glycoside hydrolase family 3 N-terminal domain-containing protein n=1 Tax=Beijerinckia indica TaxID=533 RepID=UPI0002EAE09A|nr:glycoside hydrolase family 3 N-terminal domain-containing protein [Beijerinckia indica]
MFAVVGMLAVWQAARPWIDRHYVLANREPETVDVERHFVVGYDNIATIRELVRDAHIGGIFLTRRNVEGRTLTEVAAEIDGLQSIRREAGLPGLIVAADQEGGPVSHLSPPLPIPPALSSIAGLPLDKRFEAAEQLGVVQGSALREIGITMDLAPVCDLMPQSPPGIFDRHTRIAARSISDDPTIAAVIASGFSKGLLAMGVTPTAKHFPGLGRVTADTHLFSASLNTAEEDLLKTDWVPFRAVLDIPGAAVMLSHVSLDNVEFGVPASRSKRVITGILREQWGFRGVAISDDLTMGAAQHAGLCRAVEGAFNAGIDLLLVSWDADKIYPALRCGLDALNAGRLDRAMLKQSAQRLDQLKGR